MRGLEDVPKEGERVLPPTRRLDDSWRKTVRIRAGYTPPEEIPVYRLRRCMPSVPPGHDPEEAAKAKAVKKDKKRKEKKQHATPSSDRPSGDSTSSRGAGDGAVHQAKLGVVESEDSFTQDMSNLVKQTNYLSVAQSFEATVPREDKSSEDDLVRKRKRALRKKMSALRQKIRLSESPQASSSSTATLTPEHIQKLSKLDTLRKEFEDLKTKLTAGNH